MRISVKLLTISELVLLVAVLVLIVPILTTMHDQVVEDMKKELLAIAGTAALQIDGDLHRQITEREDAQSDAFLELRRTLTAVRERNDLDEQTIYTFYHDGDKVRFAVMTHSSPFVGDPYDLRPGMLEHCAGPSQTDDVTIVCVDRL